MVSDGLELTVREAVAELDEEEEPVVVAEYVGIDEDGSSTSRDRVLGEFMVRSCARWIFYILSQWLYSLFLLLSTAILHPSRRVAWKF